VTDSDRLGRFLRSRREALTPDAIGLAVSGARRTPGLRREEVAALAGVSVQYYTRLEQGADLHPSVSVLDALGRALELDHDELAHLHRLAEVAPPHRASTSAERVDPSLARLLENWTEQPAVVIGRVRDVLAANELAAALNPAFRVGTNLLRHTFLDPDAPAIYPDWEEVAQGAVAALRHAVAPDDPRLIALVGELAVHSQGFSRIWAKQQVRPKAAGTKRFRSAAIGVLEVEFHAFDVVGSSGQTLYVFPLTATQRDALTFALITDESTRSATTRPAERPLR
jgi:transcriptional regulator with XRE-family HTH domain